MSVFPAALPAWVPKVDNVDDVMAADVNAAWAEIIALATSLGIDVANVAGVWKSVTTFTATPASTSTLTMTADKTASIKTGMSLRYTIGGVVYYGQVAAISAILLTVRGAPLSGNVTALAYDGGVISQVVLPINGTYEDASNTALLTSDNKSPVVWEKPTSYCVYYAVWSRLHDTGAHGQASLRINNTEVNTTAGGLTIAGDATWYATGVDIAVAAYDINPGEILEGTAVKGGNGDASDLCEIAVFVTP